MSDWRANPNLVECFENCVAMFRGEARVRVPKPTEADIVRQRRKSLGITQDTLAAMARVSKSSVFAAENDFASAGVFKRIVATLDRLEAERAQP